MFEHNSAGLLKYSHNIYGAEFQIHKLYYTGLEEDQLNIWTKDIIFIFRYGYHKFGHINTVLTGYLSIGFQLSLSFQTPI